MAPSASLEEARLRRRRERWAGLFSLALLLAAVFAVTTLWHRPRPLYLAVAGGAVLVHWLVALAAYRLRGAAGEPAVRASASVAGVAVFGATVWCCADEGPAAFVQGMTIWCLSMALQLAPTFLVPRTPPPGARRAPSDG